jgi:hypothetical protein
MRHKTQAILESGLLIPATAAVDMRTEQAAANVVQANHLLAAHAQPAYRLYGDGKQEWGSGAAVVPDTNLYRDAADRLKTDDALVVGKDISTLDGEIASTRAGTGLRGHSIYVVGDTFPRFSETTHARGVIMDFGPGTAAPDVNLYRDSADVLRTDDKFVAGAGLDSGGLKVTNVANPTAAQDAATKAYVDALEAAQSNEEGTQDYSATASTYAIPSGAWGTPGWYAPIIVGPNQTWELSSIAGVYTVTAVGNISNRIIALTAAGAASPPGVTYPNVVVQYQPPDTTTTARGLLNFNRLKTDATVVPGTVLRITQEFYGGNANGRVLRDGTYYRMNAWRRV